MKKRVDFNTLNANLEDCAVPIFLFHGVTRSQDFGLRNYTGKHISQDQFASIVRQLSSSGQAVSMDQVLAHVTGEESCPKHSFAVTFDDGFWNNLSIAAPILEDLSVPATFYVTTDFVEFGTCSWTDRIEAAVASTHLRTIRCQPPLEGVYSLATTNDRIALLQYIRLAVKSSRETDPEVFADELVDALLGGKKSEFVEELDRKLTWSEVQELDSHPLFSVGGHGQTHRILGYLGPDEIEEEIRECMSKLRIVGGVPAKHFSYPEGFKESYSRDVMRLLVEWNVSTSVTTLPGANSMGQRPMELRRVFVA